MLKLAQLAACTTLIVSLLSCTEAPKPTSDITSSLPPKPQPRNYVCYKTDVPINPDGILNESAWSAAPWTEPFVDIEGSVKPIPRLTTRAKILWDDTNLYIAAELEEPHVWARLRQRDTIIFYDNDFEVFIDPDADTHAYYELEVNAFATAWDLLLLKPYRDGGPPVYGWDIAGLKVGAHVDGTINNPADKDNGWSVELVIPLAALKECAKGAAPPVAGDQWRIDFSRVEWRTLVENGTYKKEINPQTSKPYPEDNWVWSPQGRINMHMPEMWGIMQFSAIKAGEGTEAFKPDPDLDVRWALRTVYYAEFDYFAKHGSYTSNLAETGLGAGNFPENLGLPTVNATNTTFESYYPAEKGGAGLIIYQDGRIVKQ